MFHKVRSSKDHSYVVVVEYANTVMPQALRALPEDAISKMLGTSAVTDRIAH